MAEAIAAKPVEYKVKKKRYEQFARQALAKRGSTLLSVNWKKRTIHYLSNTGNKCTSGFFGL